MDYPSNSDFGLKLKTEEFDVRTVVFANVVDESQIYRPSNNSEKGFAVRSGYAQKNNSIWTLFAKRRFQEMVHWLREEIACGHRHC